MGFRVCDDVRIKGWAWLCLILSNFSWLGAQEKNFNIQEVHLPAELAAPQNEFSGLAISGQQLVLLSESRVQEGQEAKIYLLNLLDLNSHLEDTTFALPYQKLNINGLSKFVRIINSEGLYYEGLEALAVRDSLMYFSIETENPHPYNYFIRGLLNDTAVTLDTNYLYKLPKPTTETGEYIYNAGVEAMSWQIDSLWNFYEYNYFKQQNVSHLLFLDQNISTPINPIPFRLTDMTTNDLGFVAINYFYKGGGKDSIYRVPPHDINYPLVHDITGWRNLCRLIKLDLKDEVWVWSTLWQMPSAWHDYNWEGLAAYDDGYFMVNDKYGPNNSRKSVLIYVRPESEK